MATLTGEVCAHCPVHASCLSYALSEGDAYFGRIAGLAPQHGREYRRKWNAKGPPIVSVEALVDPIIAALTLRRERAELSSMT